MSGGGGVPVHPDSHNKTHKIIGLTIAIFAVILSIATALCKKAEVEEVICKVESSNSWAHYQAKKLRQSFMEVSAEQLGLNKATVPQDKQDKVNALLKKYSDNAERYKGELEEISHKAKEAEHEEKLVAHRAKLYSFSEILLQISIILCSITLLTESTIYTKFGVGLAIAGAAMTAYAFFSNPAWHEILKLSSH